MRQRLFVAIDLPDAIRARLIGTCEPIEGARWVAEPQLHLTLRFIGDTPLEQRASIDQQLRRVDLPALSVALAGVGRFPPRWQAELDRAHARRPPRERPAHVLWAGLAPADAVVRLAREVEAALGAAGIEPEQRPFSPHITLARLKSADPRDVERFVAKHGSLESTPFPIDAFLLYSSVLSSGGATHRIEERYPLKPPAEAKT